MTRHDEISKLKLDEKRALLAALLREKSRAARAEAALSSGQKALWLLHQSQPESPAYNTAFAIRIHSPIDRQALQTCMQTLLERHAALRCCFSAREGEPVCFVQKVAALTVESHDVSGMDDRTLRQRVEQDYRRPFDLEQAPLMRATLFSESSARHVLLLAFHHIICDAWSMWTLVYEFSVLYPLALQAMPLRVPEEGVCISFPEFAQSQNTFLRSPEGERLWQYWQEQLSGELPLLDLPCDRPRPPVRSARGASHFFTLSAQRVAALSDLGRQNGATLYMVLLAAFQILLHRYSHQDDIIVASPVAGRNRPDVATTVGYFANPLPLRADLSGSPDFLTFLSQVRHTVLDALTHQDFPFPLMVERLQPRRDPSRSPLAEVLFVLQRPPKSGHFAVAGLSEDSAARTGLSMEEFQITQMEGQFDLAWEVVEGGPDGMPCVLKYNADLFDPSTIVRMEGHLQTLLSAIAEGEKQPIDRLPMMTGAELEVLAGWNATAKDYPLERCLHHWIEDAVVRSPDAIAVALDAPASGSLSYLELNSRANRLARYLRRRGIGPESLVGICVERSLELVVGLLGILKAGAAYLPLDPDYPPQRLSFMLADSGISAILIHAQTAARLPPSDASLIRLDEDWGQLAAEEDENLEAGVGPENLAYVIYTSGSTGRPKGAGNNHRGISNRLLWMQDEYRLDATDRILQKTPFSFDVSVWEFFWPLMTGARLVLARPGGHRDRDYLAAAILRHRISTLHFVPSMLSVFLDAAQAPACREVLRRVICSGEAMSTDLERRFFERIDVPLHNLYGPTEAAVDVTYWACQPDATARTVPIGRPIANTQIHLLDAQGSPVPVGVPGELYIGGVGVGRGYLNRPQLTAERFLEDPFRVQPGAKMYRTGDLCRRLPDGTIEYLHRLDSQIKIRGFRIELGEIEGVLTEHPEIREAVARADQTKAGDGRIVAWFVPQPGVAPDITRLRAFLRERLPDYMLPSVLIPVETMPLSPNGKADRSALVVPEDIHPGTEALVPPRTHVEQQVLKIWQEVLGRSRLGIDDNFFDVGGHSLLLARVKARLDQAFERKPTMVELFQHTTIRALARFIAGDRLEPTPVEPLRARAEQEIAVVGLAGRFPGAPDIEAFWDNLCAGREGIRFFDEAELRAAGVSPELLRDPCHVRAFGWLEGVDRFDAGFFGYSPREAELTDAQQRLLLECAQEALEHSGHDPQAEECRYGVFVGVGMNHYLLQNLISEPAWLETVGGYPLMLASEKDFAATRLSYKLNLRGPSLAVQTACSTSLVAIHLAAQSIRRGECDAALAGGCSVSLPQDRGYRYQPDMILSPDGHCRAFDARAQGTVGGNGVGVVVLKRLDLALREGDTLYAVLKGSAINNDGSDKAGFTAPSVAGQLAVIRAAQAAAGVGPDTIDYIEAHGTGTPLGDPIEISALNLAFQGATRCGIGSVKSSIGHLDAAAGVAGFIKTVLALKHGALPPSLHFTQPNPQLQLALTPFQVQNTLQAWDRGDSPRRAAVSSFGLGGTNAHAILEEAPPETPPGASRAEQLLLISARDESALDAATRRLGEALRGRTDLELADVAFTLARGRKAYAQRRFLVCRTVAQAAELLERPGSLHAAEAGGGDVAFLFSGQGSQTVGMAADLYRNEPAFRQALDRCSAILAHRFDLAALLYPASAPEQSAEVESAEAEHAAARLKQTAIAQPTLFAIEYALAQLWMGLGIRPSAMLGHSLGEYVAACLAGVFSLEDGLELVAWRGEVMQRLPVGGMMAVPLSEDAASALLAPGLSIAAVNGPGQCVLSGPLEALARQSRLLEDRGIESHHLQTSHAFHSGMMEPAASALRARMKTLRLEAPRIPYLSNVTGTWIKPDQATDPDYWAEHLRRSVRFSDGLGVLTREPGRILLEIGPGTTLTRLVQAQLKGLPAQRVIASLPSSRDAAWLEAAGRLWQAGASLDWTAFYQGQSRRRVALPSYPFQRQRFWIEPGSPAPRRLEVRPIDEWFYQASWKRGTPPPAMPGSGDHWLLLVDEAGVLAELAARLVQRGVVVTVARPGRLFGRAPGGEFTLDPAQPDDIVALLRSLPAPPQVIVHGWNLGEVTEEKSRFHSFHSLLFLAQARSSLDPRTPCRLVVVSEHLHEVTGTEELEPSRALLLGPVKVIPQEFAQLSCIAIDVDRSALDLDWIMADASAPRPEAPVIAYRGRHRWVQEFSPLELPEEPVPDSERSARSVRVRRDGAYLITGGYGGVGMALAEWLARSYPGIRLALLGRHPDPDCVRRLQELGAEVLALHADVSSAPAMLEAMDRIRERFGVLNGVVHAAGVAGGGLIHTRNVEETEPEFAAKVEGTKVLKAALAGTRLDFWVSCSSYVSILGGFGQVAYGSACAYQDHWAQAQAAESPDCRYLSISWERWRGVGMAVALEKLHRELTGSELSGGMQPERGAELFGRLLSTAPGAHVVVSMRDFDTLLKQSRGYQLERLHTEHKPRAGHARPQMESLYVPPESETQRRLAELWQEELGIESVGVLDDFFSLGGDSLLAIKLTGRLRDALSVTIPVKTLYDLPTIQVLADFIDAQRWMAYAPRTLGEDEEEGVI